MIPKPKRIRDKQAVYMAQKWKCEKCHKRAYGGPHHIISVGSGGPDHPWNLIQLCGSCHTKAHTAEILRGELWDIVAKRENMETDDIKGKVNSMRG